MTVYADSRSAIGVRDCGSGISIATGAVPHPLALSDVEGRSPDVLDFAQHERRVR